MDYAFETGHIIGYRCKFRSLWIGSGWRDRLVEDADRLELVDNDAFGLNKSKQ